MEFSHAGFCRKRHHLIDLVEALAQFGVVQNLDRKDLREAGS